MNAEQFRLDRLTHCGKAEAARSRWRPAASANYGTSETCFPLLTGGAVTWRDTRINTGLPPYALLHVTLGLSEVLQ
jgi:hypothetical protein